MAKIKNKNPWEILVQGVGVNLDALKEKGVDSEEKLEATKIFEHLGEDKRKEAHTEVLTALTAGPDAPSEEKKADTGSEDNDNNEQ